MNHHAFDASLYSLYLHNVECSVCISWLYWALQRWKQHDHGALNYTVIWLTEWTISSNLTSLRWNIGLENWMGIEMPYPEALYRWDHHRDSLQIRWRECDGLGTWLCPYWLFCELLEGAGAAPCRETQGWLCCRVHCCFVFFVFMVESVYNVCTFANKYLLV